MPFNFGQFRKPTVQSFLLVIFCLLAGRRLYAQEFQFGINDSATRHVDSLLKMKDSLTIRQLFQAAKMDKGHKSRKPSFLNEDGQWKPRSGPGIALTGGYISYQFNYRSMLDTPFVDRDIAQHQVLSSLNLTVGGWLPLRVNTLVRRSNSSFFRDITDVQVEFDGGAYRNMLSDKMREHYLQRPPSVDSIAQKLYQEKLKTLRGLQNWLKDPFTQQKQLEANEVIHVPRITYNMKLSDSLNSRREDSIHRLAQDYLDLCEQSKGRIGHLQHQVDSLKDIYDKSVDRVRHYAELVKRPVPPGKFKEWQNEIRETAPDAPGLPAKYAWLMNIRKLAIGRNNINTSELTAKNVSLKGLDFAYNSWYFLGLTAGLVDYRFRDFNLPNTVSKQQYLYQGRLGLGRLESNYIILSYFGGRKQQFNVSSSATQTGTITFSGLSVEAKWQVLKHAYLLAEMAQTFAPSTRAALDASVSGKQGGQSDNKAISVKGSYFIPETNSRLEGQYKFTGANYQSFNSNQSPAQQKSWYVKADQYFLKQVLKLTLSLKTNDYTNPYIVQQYQANTVFKTANLSFRKRGLPSVMIGYMPMSQMARVGDQVVESRFQTFTANISHTYQLGSKQGLTDLSITKFMNQASDTGFIYYNSLNLYLTQGFIFADFNTSVSFSHSKSQGYAYNVLGGEVNIPLYNRISLGAGSTLHALNQAEAGVGWMVTATAALGRSNRFYLKIDKGFLPGSGTAYRLVPNTVGTITYTRTF